MHFSNEETRFHANNDDFVQVFDVTRKVTYLNLKTWYNEMRENCPNIPCILVANKIDGKLDLAWMCLELFESS